MNETPKLSLRAEKSKVWPLKGLGRKNEGRKAEVTGELFEAVVHPSRIRIESWSSFMVGKGPASSCVRSRWSNEMLLHMFTATPHSHNGLVIHSTRMG